MMKDPVKSEQHWYPWDLSFSKYGLFYKGAPRVKKALKAGYKEGIYSDYSRDVIRPSAQECAQNGRARSTKMRWAVKSEY